MKKHSASTPTIDPAQVIKAPAPVPEGAPTVFLAGSIEMGRAENWQARTSEVLSNWFTAGELTILDPRRDEWDPSWPQSIHHPGFREQVTWELAGLEGSPVVGVFFAADARSPITLLELGLVATEHKTVLVYAGPHWYRRGNLEVVCDRYGIALFDDEGAWRQALIEACERLRDSCGRGG